MDRVVESRISQVDCVLDFGGVYQFGMNNLLSWGDGSDLLEWS